MCQTVFDIMSRFDAVLFPSIVVAVSAVPVLETTTRYAARINAALSSSTSSQAVSAVPVLETTTRYVARINAALSSSTSSQAVSAVPVLETTTC